MNSKEKKKELSLSYNLLNSDSKKGDYKQYGTLALRNLWEDSVGGWMNT